MIKPKKDCQMVVYNTETLSKLKKAMIEINGDEQV